MLQTHVEHILSNVQIKWFLMYRQCSHITIKAICETNLNRISVIG